MWYDIFTTHQFWTGAIGSGLLTGVITFLSTRASDRRKFKQEDKVLGRKEKREDLTDAQREQRAKKLREDESLFVSAKEFVQVATEVLVETIDTEGAFNMLQDFKNNLQGNDDPAAAMKIAHAKKVAEAYKRITAPHMTLKLEAEGEVLVAANRVVTALHTVVHTTTESIAVQVAQNAAAEEINNFSNAVRKEIGKSEYTPDSSKKAAMSFLDILQRQTDDFVETAREEMLAQGFGSTPWDNYERKTPKVVPPVV